MNGFSDFIIKVAVPTTAVLGIISTTIAIIISMLQHRLKSIEQRELIKTQRIESEIKLIKIFTEIMDIAHSRREGVFSDKYIEIILSKVKNIEDKEMEKAIEIIKDNAYFVVPVGLAAQDSAISAIYTLGKKYEILYESAKQGLKSIAKFKPEIANPYIAKLDNK